MGIRKTLKEEIGRGLPALNAKSQAWQTFSDTFSVKSKSSASFDYSLASVHGLEWVRTHLRPGKKWYSTELGQVYGDEERWELVARASAGGYKLELWNPSDGDDLVRRVEEALGVRFRKKQ